MNWVLFDEQFRYVESSSSFRCLPKTEFQNSNNVHWHIKNYLPIYKSGYLYVYVSNETPDIDYTEAYKEFDARVDANIYYDLFEGDKPPAIFNRPL